MSEDPKREAQIQPTDLTRRRFISVATSGAMGAGLVGGYGVFGLFAGRFLYPASDQPTQWLFISDLAGLKLGDSIPYRSPSGAEITITRQADSGVADDFIALSSICPHLGCRVHWEAENDRFFCPCHNGVFNSSGLGTEGPPAGQTLARYNLKVDAGLLYIQVPTESLRAAGAASSEAGSR